MASDIQWCTVSSHVWTTRVDPESVTIGLVMGSEHLLMVDSGSTPQQGHDLALSAAMALGRPVDRLVITHHHGDHAGGLRGVARCAKESGVAVESWMHRTAVEHGPTPAIDHPISLMAYLDLGGVTAEILHPGAAHTDGDLTVRVPEDHVTFMGDLIETSGPPQADSTTDFWDWAGAIDMVMNVTDAKDRYIPGHGDPTDDQGVMAQRNAIWGLVSAVREAMEHGRAPESALDDIPAGLDRATVTGWIAPITDQLTAQGITREGLLPLTNR